MKFLSVCSGIEAASVAWHPLGWEPLAFSEIEPFPRAVLSHHYPHVPLHGDFTVLRDQPWIVDADCLVGGTPCQAFSVAGKRNSLADERGNLTLEFVRLADAIDNLRRADGRRPAIIVWENVPGVLSVKDNAFGCFLGALAGSDAPIVPTGGKWSRAGVVAGPERRCAWRVLDAQYFGVAQRRRRVFVVASARDDIHPAEVLFEREGVRRDTPPRRGTGQEVTGTLEASIGTSRGAGTPTSILNPEAAVFSASSIGAYKEGVGKLHANGGDNGGGSENLIAGTMISNNGGGGWSNSVDKAAAGYMIPVAFHQTQIPVSSSDGTTHALGCGSSNGQASVAVAFSQNQLGEVRVSDVFNTLNTNSNASGRNTPMVQISTGAFFAGQGAKAGSIAYDEHVAPTLKASDSGTNRTPTAHIGMAVRRLTPRECEKLQGFPDDYTLIPVRNKPAADGPRYKALGNSMAVPVMAWIGKRIDGAIARSALGEKE